MTANRESQKIDLSGTWSLQLDSLDRGVTEHWYGHRLTGTIKLPGSPTTNGIGTFSPATDVDLQKIIALYK